MVIAAVDATPVLGRPTGIGVVVRGLLESIEVLGDPRLEIIGYGLTAKGWHHLAALVPSQRTSRAPMPAGPLQRIWARWDQPPIEWWTGRVDVVHGTNFVVPPSRHARRLVSVHDLTAVRFPELCSPAALRYPELVRRAISQGADVHTGAHAMAEEICEHFSVAPGRVHVVGWGITPPAPLDAAGAETGEATAGTARAAVGTEVHRSGPPYVLGLGTVEPRKDFPLLVAAFDRIADAHPDLILRIVGPPGWGSSRLDQAVAASPHAGRIRREGWVDDVNAVIAGATVFAYPSVYEGFGLPPLEAMARGVPVVATDTGALPEVVGDAADLVAVGDAEALAAGIARLVDDEEHRRRLIEQGRLRSAQFTWERSAVAMRDLYLRLAE